jgi:hypothetical protein
MLNRRATTRPDVRRLDFVWLFILSQTIQPIKDGRLRLGLKRREGGAARHLVRTGADQPEQCPLALRYVSFGSSCPNRTFHNRSLRESNCRGRLLLPLAQLKNQRSYRLRDQRPLRFAPSNPIDRFIVQRARECLDYELVINFQNRPGKALNSIFESAARVPSGLWRCKRL